MCSPSGPKKPFDWMLRCRRSFLLSISQLLFGLVDELCLPRRRFLWSFNEFGVSLSLDELLSLSSNETYFPLFFVTAMEFGGGSGDTDGAGNSPDSLPFSTAIMFGNSSLLVWSGIRSPFVASSSQTWPLDSVVWAVPFVSACNVLSINVSSCSSSKSSADRIDLEWGIRSSAGLPHNKISGPPP